MGFRFLPKSVTSNDLERRSGRYCVVLPNLAAMEDNSAITERPCDCCVNQFWPKVEEDIPQTL